MLKPQVRTLTCKRAPHQVLGRSGSRNRICSGVRDSWGSGEIYEAATEVIRSHEGPLQPQLELTSNHPKQPPLGRPKNTKGSGNESCTARKGEACCTGSPITFRIRTFQTSASWRMSTPPAAGNSKSILQQIVAGK